MLRFCNVEYQTKHCVHTVLSLQSDSTTMASAPTTSKPENSAKGRVRSVGFPRSSEAFVSAPGDGKQNAQVQPPTQLRPTPRKRSKGRLFISMILLSVFGSLGYILWNELVRYQAYGTMEGRVVPVAVPWSGIIEAVHVQDGQYVTEGQLLAVIDSAELQIRMAKLEDDIRLAQAALTTRESELQSRQHELAIDRLRSQSEYDQLLSQLHSERAKLAELKAQNQAISQLEYKGVVPNVEVSQSSSAFQGQQLRVQSLEQAIERYQVGLDALDKRIEDNQGIASDQSRLNNLIDERQRLIQYQLLGEIRSPVNGRILRVGHWKGEFVELSTELFEVLQADSLRAVLYVKQSQAADYRAGQSLQMLVPPNDQDCPFTVERIDDETTTPPLNLARYFRKDEKLVKVIAKPSGGDFSDTQAAKPVWIGAEVRLPYRLLNFLDAASGKSSSTATQQLAAQ